VLRAAVALADADGIESLTMRRLAKELGVEAMSLYNHVADIAKFNKSDMAVLAELLEAGRLKPVVERRYELSEAADALRYMGEGHAQEKLVITV
jgi:NADPH:quinone reductase-like Zn-dependent oxidoreductase